MRYFVIADDGNRYGPADVPTLNGWIGEGRLSPTTLLESEASGERVPASAVPGLMFPMAPPPSASGGTYQAPPQPGYYARPGAPGVPYGDDGSKDMTSAWIFGVLGLLTSCCCLGIVFGGFGLAAANRAKTKGHPSAQTAVILNWVAIGLGIASVLAGLGMRAAGLRNPALQSLEHS